MQHANDVPALDGPAIARRTAREQQLFLLKYLYQGVLLTCFAMAVVVLLLWTEVDHAHLLAWYGTVVAISLVRLSVLRRRRYLLDADGPDEIVHLGLHTGAFASALVCSVAAFLLFLFPATRRNLLTLNLGCVLIFAGVYIEKGMALVIPGMTPIGNLQAGSFRVRTAS